MISIIEGLETHEERLMEEFMVARLPLNKKYVVFSDVHMFVGGDFDFFNKNGNSLIYEAALRFYSNQNYHLIENGDIEDFWMRGGSSTGLVTVITDYLPYPYYSGTFEENAYRSANQIHALNVFINNARIYGVIKNSFYNQARYTRLIGNHDDIWADPEMGFVIQNIYPGIQMNDYCTIDFQDSGEAALIIGHGHQSDIFNTAMCNFAGKTLTNLASQIQELSLGHKNLFYKPKEDWEDEWNTNGFENELTEISIFNHVSFSEYNIYKDLKKIYEDKPFHQPYLILGHTHQPKDSAGIPNFMYQDEWDWDKYSNSGSVGMWEEIVFGLEIEYPDIRVIAWKKNGNNTISKYELKSYTYGNVYLKA